MKPLNNSAIRKAYFLFSCSLMGSVAIAVLSYYSFLRTESAEVNIILAKKVEYDRIYSSEQNLIASVDSVYQYLNLLNTSPKINDLILQRVISAKKQSIQSVMSGFSEADCTLYKKLMSGINAYLGVKDSIRVARKDEDMARDDLSRCVKENREISRKLKVGGIIYEGR